MEGPGTTAASYAQQEEPSVEIEQPGRSLPAAPRRRRTTDRVADAVAWLLITCALLVGVVAIGSARTAHAAALDRAHAESTDRVAVQAVLLEAADVAPAPDGQAGNHAVRVMAQWTGPGGVQGTGPIEVEVRRPAGARVPIWLDRSGQVVAAPLTAGDAALAGVARGILVALGGWLALALAWAGVRQATAARNAAAWTRGWALVEPVWSGRVTEGPRPT